MNTRNRSLCCSLRRGFTLIEVIITLSLILLLSSFVYFSGNYGFEGRALVRANSDLDMLLRAARAQAIMSGSDARLIINADETDSERFLRYAGIVERDAQDPTLWVAAHPGNYLPEGIYVVPQSMTGVAFGNWDESVSARKSTYKCENTGGSMAIANIEYPEIDPVADNTGPKWLVYQFSPDGSLDSVDHASCASGPPPINNQVVVAPGIVNSGGDIEFNNSDEVLGIVIRQNGSLIGIEDPADFYAP